MVWFGLDGGNVLKRVHCVELGDDVSFANAREDGCDFDGATVVVMVIRQSAGIPPTNYDIGRGTQTACLALASISTSSL